MLLLAEWYGGKKQQSVDAEINCLLAHWVEAPDKATSTLESRITSTGTYIITTTIHSAMLVMLGRTTPIQSLATLWPVLNIFLRNASDLPAV